MGFFSSNCKGCGKSITYDTPDKPGAPFNSNYCVGMQPLCTVIGSYDGYGGIDAHEMYEYEPEPEMWHHHCWVKAGKPQYSGPSDGARDQGYFLDAEEWGEFFNFDEE